MVLRKKRVYRRVANEILNNICDFLYRDFDDIVARYQLNSYEGWQEDYLDNVIGYAVEQGVERRFFLDYDFCKYLKTTLRVEVSTSSMLGRDLINRVTDGDGAQTNVFSMYQLAIPQEEVT